MFCPETFTTSPSNSKEVEYVCNLQNFTQLNVRYLIRSAMVVAEVVMVTPHPPYP